MSQVPVDRVGERELTWNAVDQSHHVHTEAGLQLRELEEVVENHVGVGIALQHDLEVGLATRRPVVHVGDAVDLTGVDEFLDSSGNGRTTRLIGQLCDDDLHATALALFDGRRRAHLDASASRAISVDDAGATEDRPTGREVRPFHELHQVVGCGRRCEQHVDARVDHLSQVVRRDVRGHTDRDALTAVDEQVGEAGRQNGGLFTTSVVRGHHVDRVLVDVGQQLHRERMQSTFGVATGGRTEVG